MLFPRGISHRSGFRLSHGHKVCWAPTLPKGKGLHATEILPVWHNSPLLRLASLQNQNTVLVEITQSKLNDYSVINLQTALLLWAKYGAPFWCVFMAEITTFAVLWRIRMLSADWIPILGNRDNCAIILRDSTGGGVSCVSERSACLLSCFSHFRLSAIPWTVACQAPWRVHGIL